MTRRDFDSRVLGANGVIPAHSRTANYRLHQPGPGGCDETQRDADHTDVARAQLYPQRARQGMQVQEDILAERLIPLLKPWWPTFPGFYLYYPSRMHVPRKLRVFIDFMQSRLNR